MSTIKKVVDCASDGKINSFDTVKMEEKVNGKEEVMDGFHSYAMTRFHVIDYQDGLFSNKCTKRKCSILSEPMKEVLDHWISFKK